MTDPGLDRGDQDFFGRAGLEEPVPGAEAETEKLPTQRPTSHDDPGADAPTVGADEPPDRGRPSPPLDPNGNSPQRALDPARVRVGVGAAGRRAAVAPGYLLLRDAVSTPRSYLSDAALGLTSAPRATAARLRGGAGVLAVDGGVVVKALLVLGLWLAGWGAARLAATVLPEAGWAASSSRPPSRSGIPMWPNGFCRATGACWSATAVCRGWRRRCWAADGSGFVSFALAFWIAVAGLTPTGLMLAATVGLVCAL